jgi:peptidoglycan/xylan/chitin deacetylase (PgdA/CDA1 family)
MAPRFPILTFHAVDDRRSVISFPPGLFARVIARLSEKGYRTLSLLEAADHLRGKRAFPERAVVITFDDGYQSVYDHAFPVLQRHGFSATIFLAVGEDRRTPDSRRLPSMCDRSMLSWREIREMHRSGIAFGGHTLTHPDLTLLSDEQIEAEVVGGKAVMEDALGAPAASFAYPFGHYDERCREIVSRHFACACSDRLGLLGPDSDPYALERVDAYYLRSEKWSAAMTTALFPFYVRARSVPRQIRRSLGF